MRIMSTAPDDDDPNTDDDSDAWEEFATFVGPCTCEHTSEDHGWGGCIVEVAWLPGTTIVTEVCPCEAGWEE